MLVNKMQAYGNDFCVVEFEHNVNYEALSKSICDRRLGVGGLGLIVVKTTPDLEMFIYDSFGKRAAMDINALFCFAKYVTDYRLVRKSIFDVIFSNTKYNITKEDNGFVLNMGMANYNNAMLRINDSISSFGRVIRIDNDSITIYSLYVGDIHTIIIVDDFEAKIVEKASLIINNPLFKNKTNVHFVKVLDKGNIEIKSYDKNNNYLLSSAGGAAASAFALNKLKLIYKNVNVEFEMGSLSVELKKDKALVKGNSIKVFECEYKGEN